MTRLPELASVLDLKYGRDPALDAWLLHFMTENNLEYAIDPQKNASPEQVRFMVALQEDEIFAPCSDWMLLKLLSTSLDAELLKEYNEKWRTLARLNREHVPDAYLRRRITGLCRHKYKLVQASPIVIPSRFMKRLITIFLTQSGQSDPSRGLRKAMNQRAADLLGSDMMDSLINACPSRALSCSRLADLRLELALVELRRLFVLSTLEHIWEQGADAPTRARLEAELSKPCVGFEAMREVLGDPDSCLRILYIPDMSGGVMFDIRIIRTLLRQGHKVVLSLKEGFHFDAPTCWDLEYDPVLARALEGAKLLFEPNISKNELLGAQRENQLVVISDGTRERLNLYRTSVTFARAWKEADLVIAKGVANHRRLILTSHLFTRDVICFFRDQTGAFRLEYKPKAPHVGKFTEQRLLAKAESLIGAMRRAKGEGNQVMFYSAIIGSIPGQTATAIRILNTFAEHLRSRLEKTFIINPAEYFEEGLDADDLMYMWEKVQRSGLIDVWRFQMVADIEKSFELMEEKVPPFWAGKDSTFSTGCTKEMRIALEEQQKYPEMQIIGPSAEKFFRRREYGVGKFCDKAIDCQ